MYDIKMYDIKKFWTSLLKLFVNCWTPVEYLVLG